jgi:putative ABC transport system permease protein
VLRLTIRTALTNLRSRRLNTILLGVIIAGGAMSLALAAGLHSNASHPFDQTVRATNGADVHVIAFDGRSDIASVAHMAGVAERSGPYEFASAQVTGEPADAHLTLEAMATRPALEHPDLSTGRWVGSGTGEVVLERTFARARKIHVGDRMRVRIGSQPHELRVVGIAVSAARGPFPAWDPAAAWVAPATLDAVQPVASRRGRELHLRLADGVDSTAFADRAQKRFPPEQVGAYSAKEIEDDITSDTSGLTVILGSASLLALLGAGFVIANAISGRVLASRREIGLLKAAGFTPGGVTALFVAENLILALAAGVIGTIAAIPVTPLLLHRSAELLGTPTPSGFAPQGVVAGVLGVAVIVTVFTVLPAWRAGRLKVLEAIRLGRSSVSSRPSRTAELAARLRLPTAAVVGVKDAFAARSRAVMTVLSLILTVTAVVATLGTEATYRRVVGDSSLRAKPYDLLLQSDSPAAKTRALLAPHRGDYTRAVTIAAMPVRAAGGGLELHARAIGGNYRARPYAIRDGRMLAGPGEAIVGRGLLDKLGLHVGDKLRLTAMGEPLDLTIVGRYVEPDDDAVTAIFDQRSLSPAARRKLRPDFGLTVPSVPAARRLGSELATASHGAVQATVTEDEVKQERADVRPIIWGMDVLLLSIGLVNLVTTMLLGIRERRRDFAIFKATGFTPRQVLGAVTAGGSLLALVALAIGIPVGAGLFRAVVIATNPTDGPDLATTPTWWWLLLLVPGILVFTTIASLLPARRAAEIQPAEALRYE